MESTRYGAKTANYSDPVGVQKALAMLDQRLADMKAEEKAAKKTGDIPTWEKKDRDHALRISHNRRTARGIPLRFVDASMKAWNTIHPEAKYSQDMVKAKADLVSWASAIGLPGAPSLVLLGANGTGKSEASCGILNDRFDQLYAPAGDALGVHHVPGMEGIYTTAKGYTDRLKATYTRDSAETTAEVLELHAEVALLVLDEIGRQFDTETEKNYMFELINERYNRHKQTLLIANLSAEEFKALMGTAITDRLRQSGGKVVVFNWPTLRS